jgi:hypothetical protein
MSLNKRFFNISYLRKYVKNSGADSLHDLFVNIDIYVFEDKLSYEIYQLYKKGDVNQIKHLLNLNG